MKLIQAGPDMPIFMVWQWRVQMLNFREFGLEEDAVILVGIKGKPSEEVLKFKEWTKATVIFYEDTRESRIYMPSIRPHLIKKYLAENPTEVFFYHDQDIIFLENPKLDDFEKDSFSYVAPEPKGYLWSPYVKAFKDGDLFTKLTDLMGISKERVEQNDDNCGGAQYIIRGTNDTFWGKVEKDCEEGYKFLLSYTAEDARNKVYHYQNWQIDMHCVFWNLLRQGEVRQLKRIDFAWPYDTFEDAKSKGKIIMHNAGIAESNRNHPDGTPRYFDKGNYNEHHGAKKFPFDDDFSFIDSNILQSKYVGYFKQFQTKPDMSRRFKIIASFNTTYGRETGKINEVLLQKTLGSVTKAAKASKHCDVEVVTTSWKPIPNNPHKEFITPFHGMGHLNYILQLKQGILNIEGDIVTICEHDCLYPENYFDEIALNWDGGKYGLNMMNYAGVNKTGFLDVVERHKPFSIMSYAKGFFNDMLNKKIDMCVKNIGDWNGAAIYGWCLVEEDNKALLKDYWGSQPMIHVSMENMSENHHLTSHNTVCYERDSKGKFTHPYWGNYLELLPFFNS